MPKVLVVDDDPVCSKLLPTLLTSEGYEVKSASSAQDAIAAGGEFQPDLLIADWLLKNQQDGVDVARALFDKCPALRIIFMTGLPADQLAPHTAGLPVAKIMEKPVNVDELLLEIAAALSGSG